MLSRTDREVAVPADRIQRVERIGDDRQLAAPLDRHAPLVLALLGAERVVDLRRVQHRRVEQGVAADHAAVRHA